MKKLLSVLAAVIVAMAMMPAMAFAEDDGSDAPLRQLDDVVKATVPAGNGTTGYASVKYHCSKAKQDIAVALYNGGDERIMLAVGKEPVPPAEIKAELVVDPKKTGTEFFTATGPLDYYIYVLNQGDSDCDFMLCNTARLAQGKITSLKAGKKSLTAKWKKVSGAEKYIVYYKTGSKEKTKVTKKTSLKIKSLKKGKKYTVRVQAYKECGEFEFKGDASSPRTVRVK